MARLVLAIMAIVLLAGAASGQQASNCSRADILKAIQAVPEWSTVAAAITALNASALLPDQAGKGTLFLPIDSAFAAVGIPATELVTKYPGQLLSVLAYHSLLAQGVSYSRSELRAQSTIQTDLGVFQTAIKGENVSLPLVFSGTIKLQTGETGGLEEARGVGSNARVRAIERVCGYFIYRLDGVLLPTETLQTAPTNTLSAIQGLPANTSAPAGLGAAVASGAVALNATNGTDIASDQASDAAGPASGPAAGPDGSALAPASAPGAAGAPGAAAVAAIAGQALAPNGTDGTLTTTAPVLLLGTVGNDSSAAPGLYYVNGSITNGVGEAGTITRVRSLNSNGATLAGGSGAAVDLAGTPVNGSAFDASTLQIRNSSGSAAATGFGAPLNATSSGTFSATGVTIFDGTLTGGKAANASAATGTAAKGSLGPGPILINGTVTNGKGSSGTAYPIVAVTSSSIRVNSDNAVSIKGATFVGTAFNGTTNIPVRLQAASAAGGAGAASAGSPGVAPPGPASGPATAPATAPAPAPQAAAATAAGLLSLAAAGAAALLLA